VRQADKQKDSQTHCYFTTHTISSPLILLLHRLPFRAGGPDSTVDPDKESFYKLLSQRDLGSDAELDDRKGTDIKLDVKSDVKSDIKSEIKAESDEIKGTQHTNTEESSCGWRRVCGVDQIRRVVEGLGDSSADQDLRINLVTSLLADRRGPEVAGTY
jgi:hypothetical protein